MLKLAEDEREVLLAEVAQALDQVRSPDLKRAYGELLTAVDRSEIPTDLLPQLETLLEVGLESGRIRRLHRADGETAAGRVYGRTPLGRAVRQTTDEVNESLRGLQGQSLEEISFAPAGPGGFTVTLGTDQGRVLLKLTRQGVRIQSLELGA